MWYKSSRKINTPDSTGILASSVADPAFHFDADPDHVCHFDADPDHVCHYDADPDRYLSFQFGSGS